MKEWIALIIVFVILLVLAAALFGGEQPSTFPD